MNITTLQLSCPLHIADVLYLFAHADLHDSIVDERLPQIFVFLLLKALHVHPRPLDVFSAVIHLNQHRTSQKPFTLILPASHRVQDSLAFHRFLLDSLFTLCYQLLQQLQSGLPLLRCLLAKKLVGHAFEGEGPHNLRKTHTQSPPPQRPYIGCHYKISSHCSTIPDKVYKSSIPLWPVLHAAAS